MSVDPFNLICGSCEYRHIEYNSKAEEYGLDGFSNSCERREYGIERCPKAAEWRRYFQEKKEPKNDKK